MNAIKSTHLYSISILAISLACLAYFLALPIEPNNHGFFGYSSMRILPAVVIFLVALSSAGYLFLLSKKAHVNKANQKKITQFVSNSWIYAILVCLLAGLILIASLILISSAQSHSMVDNALIVRLRPLILWVDGISLSTLVLLISSNSKGNRKVLHLLLGLPPVTWITVGYLVSFALFYLPIYLFQIGKLDFPDFVQSSEPVGQDMRRILDLSAANVLHRNLVPRYQPFPLVFFLPLTFIDFTSAYQLLVVATFFCYIFISFIFPLLISKGPNVRNLILIVGGLGLFSYGLGFEMENGQFNLITFTFSIVAIFLFHFRPRHRLLAYGLITMAIQLKLWPGIFILMLIDNWGEWKTNLRRIGGLLVVNAIGFFILGPQYLAGFINFFVNSRSDFLWEGNASVDSFLSLWALNSRWIAANFKLLNLLFLAVIAFCLLAIIFQSWKRKSKGFNPYLFFACGIGAMLIPSFSYDFKLPMLTTPLIIYSATITQVNKNRYQSILLSILLLISIAYSSTNFSYVVKSLAFKNNFPALLLILILVTVSYFLVEGRKLKTQE